jgi:hypothetical protein
MHAQEAKWIRNKNVRFVEKSIALKINDVSNTTKIANMLKSSQLSFGNIGLQKQIKLKKRKMSKTTEEIHEFIAKDC